LIEEGNRLSQVSFLIQLIYDLIKIRKVLLRVVDVVGCSVYDFDILFGN
jgi:hypothetical protein